MPQDALAAVGLLVGLRYLFRAFFARSRVLLKRWAADNGFELLEDDYRLARKGPFWWSQRGQVVYRVRIRDPQGQERGASAYCSNCRADSYSSALTSGTHAATRIRMLSFL